MQINHSEFKDLTSVITLTLTPADYEEAVQRYGARRTDQKDVRQERPG